MFTPSVADPQNTPPEAEPCATRRSQTIFPAASGSKPKITPDLLPTTISWRPFPTSTRNEEPVKSKSGASLSGQTAGSRLAARQLPFQMSFSVICFDQRTCPVSRSSATSESESVVAGGAKLLPVPTYSTRRLTSIVGVFQMAPPAGPYSCVPMLFFAVGTGVSATVYVFQIRRPVAASSATTLPRNEQQG